MFQFPSNGKVDSEGLKCSVPRMFILVSIPFKRESGFRAKTNGGGKSKAEIKAFQFPSNGKVDSETTPPKGKTKGKKFQFPSNGKVDSEQSKLLTDSINGLVSIPFKRESGFRVELSLRANTQPPVSIPFKRESVFRVLTPKM